MSLQKETEWKTETGAGNNTGTDLYGREGPVGVGGASSVLSEGDAGLLVVDVVVDVAQVPNSEVSGKL
jgi:hypothetical protein